MKLISIYEHMEKGAKAVPTGDNCKIVFRHSIREKITEGNDVCLTNEGVELARSFGRYMAADIGFVASSTCKRNIQTCKEIFYGKRITKDIVPAQKELELPHAEDLELSSKVFEYYSFQGDEIIFRLNNEASPGFNSIDIATKIMLNYIFSNGNQKNTVDLFCTHDFQMAILYSGLFGFAKTRESLKQEKWPMMLEGMILWGNRKHFFCAWRNVIKEFVNF